MPRPQFSIRTLLWLTLVVAAFLGGMALQKQLDKPLSVESIPAANVQFMEMRDGAIWMRSLDGETSGPQP